MADKTNATSDSGDEEDRVRTPASSPMSGDPRLEIPELLRTPLQAPKARAELAGMRSAKPATSDSNDAAKSWAIALNFVYGVIAGCLLGWALQTWVWPNAAPWPLLTGAVTGLIIGFVRFIREAIRANQE